jgi:hypothetical protein
VKHSAGQGEIVRQTPDIGAGVDIIDIRDVIARVEELREARDAYENDKETQGLPDGAAPEWAIVNTDDAAELASLETLLGDCEGNGGDEKWEGSWYPLTLIHEDYFETYARELAEDIGAINKDAPWPARHIDWAAASEELKEDYTIIEYDGQTYYAR